MHKKYKLSTALDIDDLLMECVPYAIRLANEKYHFSPPLSIYEVNRWGKLGTRADVIFEFFNDPEFFRTQPVIQGAKEFVRKLSQMTEVFVSTSVYPQFMSIRAQRIMEEFPEIPYNFVTGNCDIGIVLPSEAKSRMCAAPVEVGKKKFLLMHGHMHEVKKF